MVGNVGIKDKGFLDVNSILLRKRSTALCRCDSCISVQVYSRIPLPSPSPSCNFLSRPHFPPRDLRSFFLYIYIYILPAFIYCDIVFYSALISTPWAFENCQGHVEARLLQLDFSPSDGPGHPTWTPTVAEEAIHVVGLRLRRRGDNV